MYCLQCGNQLPQTARFCNACGTQQMTAQTTPIAVATVEFEPPKKKTGNRSIGKIIVSVLAGLTLVLAAIFSIQKFQEANAGTPTATKSSASSSSPPVQQNHVNALLNDNFVLPPGYIKTINFHVRGLGTVTGRFQAKGGIDDAIRVVITNQDGYTNYSKNNAFRSWYNSNEVAVDNINVTLGPGDYVLLYSTTGSLTNRTIQTNVTLSDFY